MSSTIKNRGTESCGFDTEETRMIGDRYRVIKILKRDRTGEHFLTVDRSTGKPAVVRLMKLSAISASMRLHLEYEAKVLSELNCPYVTTIQEVGEEDDHFFVVRPYLSRITLRERLERSPLDFLETIKLGQCLFSALQAVHDRGIIHHNIRPTNILFDDNTANLSAVLSDFSLGATFSIDDLSAREAIEAAVYLSPESLGALDYEIDETSDLYSAGLVLFECLTRHPPFQGDKAGSILYQHMTASVPELRSMGVELPLALDELIQRLLHKDPHDRYQKAQAVLMDLAAIVAAVSGEAGESGFVVDSHDHRPTLTEPGFVGREDELERIEEQIQRVLSGEPRLVYLEAESGGGKSRLLREVSLRGVKEGMWVLRSQGVDQSAQRPFQMLHGIVEQATAKARSDREFAAALKQQMGEHLDVLGVAFPELARLLGWNTPSISGPEAFAENRMIQALAALFRALENAKQPALIILDDCQWADELTYKLIRWWQSQIHPSSCHVMLVVAFRSDEVSEKHLLRSIEPSEKICLSVLSADNIRLLLESMAGQLPESAVNLITQFAEGNPFMASAMLRGMVESGALLAEAGGWRVEPMTMTDLSSSNQAASFLTRRLDILPPGTVRLLSMAAILGKKFELGAIAELSGQEPIEAIVAIEEARQRHLVWSSSEGSSFAFVHDKIRNALLDRMTFAERKEFHRQAALYLQRTTSDRISDIAYHFDAASDGMAALPYALQAAEEARAQFALEAAEQQYRIARRGNASATNPVRFRIAEGLGDVLMLRGKYIDAGDLFEDAAVLAEDSYSRAQILGKIGELAHKRGDMQGAALAIEEALRLLGTVIPRKIYIWGPMLLWQIFVQIMHTILPPWLRGIGRRKANDKILLQIRLFSRLSYAYWYSQSRALVFLVHLLGMNRVERYPATPEMAQVYSEHAVAMTLVGLYKRGIGYAQRSLKIRQSLGDVWGQGQSLSFYGVVLYAASRYQECVEKCTEATRLLERTGDWWEVHIAKYQIAASLYRMGNLREAVTEARQLHLSGIQLGDEQASGISLDIWARASGGNVPHNSLKIELERNRTDIQARAQVLMAQGVQLTQSGRIEEAADIFDRALTQCKRVGVMNAYVAPNLSWLATALRQQAESPKIRTANRRGAIIAQAEVAAHRAVKLALRLQNDLPHALRENALILAMSGKNTRVRRLLKRSMAIASRQGARYEYAQSLLAYGQIGVEMDWPKAGEKLTEAQRLLVQLRVPGHAQEGGCLPSSHSNSLSLYDRFDNVLVAGRKIASALSGTAIFEEARNAALRLLRAEHCQVLQILGNAKSFRLIPVAGEIEEVLDENLARRAILAEKAIAFDADSAQQPGANVNGYGKQSTLCVPLFVRGRAVACLYAVHQHVQKLFGPDEERLADFIATIAGAALENAEGFKQLQELNATLEQRIVERTAAAESRARELALSNHELERVATELLQTQAQLHVAMQSANAANHAKSRFLATMSHEIRTPMNGILGMVELALSTSLTGQQRNYLTALKDSANLLLEIINDILDFSKIEAGKMELESIRCDVSKVVDDVARLLAVSAFKKDLELVCRIDPQVPQEVLGDPKRLRQIIVNLLGNAIKFTDRGEVLLRVNVEHASETKARLHFAVRDTGIGIAADKIDHIFEAFRQSDSSVTRRFGGTGLGLSISSQLVDLMGGRIWAESELGRGSTFHFTVDFLIPEKAQIVLPTAPFFGNRFALIVSRNENVREYCEEILENAGMHVRISDNRESALEAIASIREIERKSETPSLLVVDAGMSRSEGFEFMESLQGEDISDWRAVMLAPAGLVDGFERCQKMAIRHCITKPVKAAELLETAHAALGNGAADAEPVVAESSGRQDFPLHVLVADDSSVNQEVALGLLELRGYSVQLADNGRDAVEAYRKGTFDAILMDLEMPEMDGLSAAMKIRDLEQNGGRRVPILAMTAHVLNSVEQQCLEAGMDGYISKPIQPTELYQALEKFCSKSISGPMCCAK